MEGDDEFFARGLIVLVQLSIACNRERRHGVVLYIVPKRVDKAISEVGIKCPICRIGYRLILSRFFAESLTEVAERMIKEEAPQESEGSGRCVDCRRTILKLGR